MTCTDRKYIYPHRSIDWIDSGKEELPVMVPCGKCIPCLNVKRQEWIIRLEQEYKHSTSALFVTLTYDQKHLPNDNSLNKKHVQDYMKRLRKMDGTNKLRYYLTGEYGSKTGRPHYHILLFNAQEHHARMVWRDSKQKPIGMVHIGRVTQKSIAYCTKYIVQPELATTEKQKPFALMSRAYGIGGHYLTDLMVAWHKEDDRNYMIIDRQKARLPRFYRSKIWYHENQKEKVSTKAKKIATENAEKELGYFRKKYGSNAENKMAEFRTAALQRAKAKLKFTQTF